MTITKETMDKINRFSRKELTAEEVYTFSVILCDNDVDRDCEKFSVAALTELAKLYVGKTGIFNHDPKGENQTARIYDTHIERDTSKKTADGEVYTCLKADAYMVKTDKNTDLIKEIDGGIKKEVSVGCSVARELCSVCGHDRRTNPCNHRKGTVYNGKKCFGILSDPTDAYEWSFVAVPAQRAAGVTKKYGEPREKSAFDGSARIDTELYNTLVDDLRQDIIRLSFLEGDSVPVTLTKSAITRMDIAELVSLKQALANSVDNPGESRIASAIEESKTVKPSNGQFKL